MIIFDYVIESISFYFKFIAICVVGIIVVIGIVITIVGVLAIVTSVKIIAIIITNVVAVVIVIVIIVLGVGVIIVDVMVDYIFKIRHTYPPTTFLKNHFFKTHNVFVRHILIVNPIQKIISIY